MNSFRRFLERSFRRLTGWMQSAASPPAAKTPPGTENLLARLYRWSPVGIRANLPDLEGLGPGEALLAGQAAAEALQNGWRLDLGYHYRSLDCQVQVSLQPLTPGLQRILRALSGPQ